MESIWEGGQAFVAFSRVETIDGLYLADYHPLKIRVDKSCLVEYNRLRESIGLTKFPIPSGKTINKGPEPVNIASQRRFRKRSSLATNVIIPTKIARIENDNENVVMVEEDGDNFDIVYRDVNGEALRQFVNTRDDCFLIAAINFLYRIQPVVNHFLHGNYDDNIELLHELANLLRHPAINTVSNVRMALDNRYHSGYQDCISVLDEILDKLSNAVLETLTITNIKTITCQCRSRQPALKIHTSITFTMNRQDIFPANIQRITFDDFFTTWSRRVSQCSGCENHKITTVRLQDPHNTTLHYIRINIDGGANRGPLNVTYFSEVTMFNIQWRLIAAVEFVPGHFKTWVNVNLEWKIIDDSVINDAKRLKTNILCYRMLLYQRIE